MTEAHGSSHHGKPQVTFALLTYNQEAYVRAAVLAALGQTYSPLEILISDDASSDGTAAILHEEVQRYSGPHRVIFNVNAENLGIGQHINRVFQIASGDLVVLAAGDDVSSVERTARTVAWWMDNRRRPSAIYCRARSIDASGRPLGEFSTALPDIDRSPSRLIGYDHPSRLLLLGACSAYSKEVYSRFGPLMPSLAVEDIPLTVRASLLGGVGCMDERLVDYRVNVSVWLPRKFEDEDFERHVRRMIFRLDSNRLVSMQIAADTDAHGDPLAVRAARRRMLASDFAWRTCTERRFSLPGYIMVGIRSGHWRAALFPAALLAFPRLHQGLFKLKRRMRKRSA